MKVLIEGHKYELANHAAPELPGQTLQFIHKQPVPGTEGGLVTVEDGTTNEEILCMMVDRLKSLQKKMPGRENAIAITHIETALLWLQKRTADRVERKVEGTTLS